MPSFSFAVARLLAYANKRYLGFVQLAQKIRCTFVQLDEQLFFPKLLTFAPLYDIIVLSVRGEVNKTARKKFKKFQKTY